MPKYDVAIIGAGLGGLAVAALLSGKNKKAIVIERSPSLSDALGAVEKNGFIFSTIPSLSFGFETGGVLQNFATHLGIVPHVAVPSPCYQVALPDHRITVFAEHEATLAELRREFPKEIDALTAFYHAVEKLSFQTRENRVRAYLARLTSAAGFMAKFQFSAQVSAFFDIQARYFFQKPVDELSLETFLTLCNTPPRRLQGGFKRLAEQLCTVILQHGGEIRYNEPSSELLLKDTRLNGVKTSRDIIDASTVLLNTLPARTGATLFVALLDDVVPLGMSTDVLFLPAYDRADEYAMLSMDAREDNAIELAGSRALTVSFAPQKDAVASKEARMEQVSRLIPFLPDFVFFSEDYEQGAGHAILPTGVVAKPLRSGKGGPLFQRTSSRNLFVLENRLESPLQVIAAARRFVEKMD